MRVFRGPVFVAIVVMAAHCATVTREQLDRCLRAPTALDDAHRAVLGAACRTTAEQIAGEGRPREAVACARKACELGDARGCGHYLWLTHEDPALEPSSLAAARATGERACENDAMSDDQGRDLRILLCERTALLYRDRDPIDAASAARMYLRACKLGDDVACRHAQALGIGRSAQTARDVATAAAASDVAPAVAPADPAARTDRAAPATAVPQSSGLPDAAAGPATASRAPLRGACHDMHDCVTLSLWARSEEGDLVGTLTSHCERRVACTWCPARGDSVDRSACGSATLAPGERRYGQSDGLYYKGFSAIAYDCSDADDDARCRSL
jgi:hypothetical protein